MLSLSKHHFVNSLRRPVPKHRKAQTYKQNFHRTSSSSVRFSPLSIKYLAKLIFFVYVNEKFILLFITRFQQPNKF